MTINGRTEQVVREQGGVKGGTGGKGGGPSGERLWQWTDQQRTRMLKYLGRWCKHVSEDGKKIVRIEFFSSATLETLRTSLWVELTKKVDGGFVDVSTVAKKQRTTYTDTGEFPAETFKKRVRTWFNGKAAKKVKKAFKDSHNNALEQATAPEATAREGIQAGYRL